MTPKMLTEKAKHFLILNPEFFQPWSVCKKGLLFE